MHHTTATLIDTHCHLDVTEFDADRRAVLERARRAGVQAFIVPGILAATWGKLVELCGRENDLFPALGIHPLFLDQSRPGDLDELEYLVGKLRPIAVGEIGLDYALKPTDRAKQRVFFQRQLEIANRHRLPVIIHARKSHDDIITDLKNEGITPGIIHAFSGSTQQADHYIRLGFKLGFGGMLTFDRSTRLRELARNLPLEAIVLETDSPDMTVASHRGERNSPEYLPEVLSSLAEIRQLGVEEIAARTTANALEVFSSTELQSVVASA